MRAALMFEDDKGVTHHFEVELQEDHLPMNPQAAIGRLNDAKSLRKPARLEMLVHEETMA